MQVKAWAVLNPLQIFRFWWGRFTCSSLGRHCWQYSYFRYKNYGTFKFLSHNDPLSFISSLVSRQPSLRTEHSEQSIQSIQSIHLRVACSSCKNFLLSHVTMLSNLSLAGIGSDSDGGSDFRLFCSKQMELIEAKSL